MLNNFCFHVYAQKSLFIGENDNEFLAGNSKLIGEGGDDEVKKTHCNFCQ